MKISRDWLSDFVDWIETDPEVIADRITRGVGEVDEVEMQGGLMENCVIGKILTLGRHPNADKLSVCTVQTDDGIKKIVCGGTNLRQDMLVAFAHVGATVKAGGKEMVTLQKVKIRGEESEGMICAAEEVEIEALFPAAPDDGVRPVADLTKGGYKPGTPLRKALGLTDVIFHIDNHAITNRPDLFSHIGVAREIVAMGLATWKKEPSIPNIKFPSTAAPFKLTNEVKDLIPFLDGAVASIEGVGPSPDWMQKRLLSVGWRPINLIVDITNYVLMEVGMPLHAFDIDDFKGELHIRMSKKGEKITTLDKVERTLPENAIVINDDEGIFDLFGIMGGLRSSMKTSTRKIFIQADIPDPVCIRRTVVAMGHRTDAATVYEKGVLPITAQTGLRRAVELLLELSPGAKLISKPITWGKSITPKAVKADLDRVLGYIGVPAIDAKRAKKILTDLGCEVKGTGKTMTVVPPVWRRDITHIQDVAEEVARVYGYANATPVMPDASIMPPVRDQRINLIRDGLKEKRATELLHLAFTSPETIRKTGLDPAKAVTIENPIGEEISRMRTHLLPALLETAGRELTRAGMPMLKVFEYGQIFSPGSERGELVLLTASKGKTTLKDDPLLVTKADLTHAMKQAGYAVTFAQTKESLPPFAHAGRSATISCKGKIIGLITEVSPHVRQAFDIAGRAATAVIDLQKLLEIPSDILIVAALSGFPAVEFDETLGIPKTPLATLTSKLLGLNPLLRTIVVADLYEGEKARTLTLRFTYRADDRTLTQEEVEKIHAGVLAELKKA